jgi:methylmalonyl-CoA/ethylmalonyl-CoA epimerase
MSDSELFGFDHTSPEYQTAVRLVREILGPQSVAQIEQMMVAGAPLSEQIGWFFTKTWGGLYAREQQLPLRDRALLLIGIDLALGRVDPLREHLMVARHAGVTRRELEEVMFQSAFYLGVPILPMCLRAARDLFANEAEEKNTMVSGKDAGVVLGTINHIAMVARDWRATAEKYAALLGVKRWKAIHVTPSIMTRSMYYGRPEPCAWISAFAKSGDTLLELCQPLEGKSIYDDFFREKGEGVHHVADLSYRDPAQLVSAWTAQGVEIAQYFHVGDAIKIYFLDTRAQLAGAYTEVVDPPSYGALPDFGEDVIFD